MWYIPDQEVQMETILVVMMLGFVGAVAAGGVIWMLMVILSAMEETERWKND
jgi:hypothetical protein